MELQNLALLRFDFVLGEDGEYLVRDFEDHFGDPSNRITWSDIRDNELQELTFEAEPGIIGLPPEFDSLTIRVIESTDAVTEIITLATVDSDQLEPEDQEENSGIGFVQRQDWEYRIGNIRTFIPGEEQGSETTVFWVKADDLPEELEENLIDLEAAHQALSEEEPHEFLDTFGVSSSSGILVLEEETLIIPRDPSQLWDILVAIDLDENVRTTASLEGLQLHGPWSALSTLYGIHFWSRVRGKELDDFEEMLDDADTELPTDIDDVDLNEYLDLDATIFGLQEEWVSLYSQISRELRQLNRRLDNYSANFDELSRRQIQAGSDSDEPGLLESYITQLENELERVRFDSDRLDNRLSSLSTVFHDRVSMITTRENIQLQQRVSDQTDQSLGLQSRVFWFTVAVVGLTVVLVADAAMSGGLSAFVDRLFNRGLNALTTQMIAGITIILIAIVILMAYSRRSQIAQVMFQYIN